MGRSRVEPAGKDQANWKLMAPFPFMRMSQLIKMSNDEFFAIPPKERRDPPVDNDDVKQRHRDLIEGDGIYKYNVNTNVWTRLIEYDDTFKTSSQVVYAAYDPSNQLLFVSDGKTIFEFDLNSKSMKVLNEFAIRRCMSMICVDGILHLLSANAWRVASVQSDDNDYKHEVFNKDIGEFKEIHKIKEFDGNFFKLLHLKKKKNVILFDPNNGVMHTYQTWNNEWVPSKIKNEYEPISNQAYVSTANEQHIIGLSGVIRVSYPSVCGHYITMFDVRDKVLKTLKAKCPVTTGLVRAVMMTNEKRDEVMVYGFVNQCFESEEYQNIQRLPKYLIQLISQWISNEYIHLIDQMTGNHWKIHIDEILNQKELSLSV